MRHGAANPLVDSDDRYTTLVRREKLSRSDLIGDVGDGQAREVALQRLARLARLINNNFLAPGKFYPNQHPGNRNIPAGYTYLGQLIAHDLSYLPGPLPAEAVDADSLRNLATAALDLDCIYGGGPSRLPWLYEWQQDDIDGEARGRLRLGFTRPARHPRGNPALEQPRLADMPRICPAHPANSVSDSTAGHDTRRPLVETLLADPRNEDNLILAQVALLFYRLHNRLFDAIRQAEPALPAADAFRYARALTLACYRRVVVHDFLKRLLDPAVWESYWGRDAASRRRHDTPMHERLRRQDILVTPVEFTMAAFRIGHVMVRKGYRLNDHLHAMPGPGLLLKFRSGRPNDTIPLRNDWLVDWHRFFPALGPDGAPAPTADFNASMPLRPAIASDITDNPQFMPEATHRPLSKTPAHEWGGLVYRDLARAFDASVPTAQALARELNVDDTLSKAELRAALRDPEHVVRPSITEEDAALFAERTPLFYYVLLEAELRGNGERLGPLGSTIVGEVLAAAIEHRGARAPVAAAELSRRRAGLFPGGVLPSTMPALVDFVQAPPA